MAGVVHGLREQARAAAADSPFAVCVFRSWRATRCAVCRRPAGRRLQELAGEEPLAAPAGQHRSPRRFRAWTEQAGALLVVLDQFEEYFQYHPRRGRRRAPDGLRGRAGAASSTTRTCAVNVLLSIREDAWAKLDRFEGHIPSLFANYVRVDHLDLEAAREAIEGPIEAWNRCCLHGEQPYEIEPALVEP